jgi:hypothetical protein
MRDRESRANLTRSLRSSLMLLAFGLFILAYLVAIDRPHWFRVKPATGTAAAMAVAADVPTRS